MKVLVLYHFNSDQERSVIEFEREYESRTGRKLVTFDLESVEGAELAKLYDVTRFPAVVATTDGGEMLQLWQGDTLPLINEVMYYDKPD